MSAPNTNIEKQTKRHKTPLVGMGLGLAFVVIVAFFALVWPGIPRDEQAAADGAPTQTVEGTAAEVEASQ